jgi:hypothetical protein
MWLFEYLPFHSAAAPCNYTVISAKRAGLLRLDWSECGRSVTGSKPECTQSRKFLLTSQSTSGDVALRLHQLCADQCCLLFPRRPFDGRIVRDQKHPREPHKLRSRPAVTRQSRCRTANEARRRMCVVPDPKQRRTQINERSYVVEGSFAQFCYAKNRRIRRRIVNDAGWAAGWAAGWRSGCTSGCTRFTAARARLNVAATVRFSAWTRRTVR